ncbi:MAG: helix-turn-helix domain-containing protein [Muribaculaceae bacterium]|nr:helix-turn-helix domain-containing protein [Muribaculaceae bacterium]
MAGHKHLYSFDGYRGTHIDYSSMPFYAQVYSIVPDKQADSRREPSFWLGTNNGVYRYVPSERRLEAVATAAVPEIRALLLMDRRLLIASLGGLYVYDVENLRLEGPVAGLPHNAVYSLYADEAQAPGMIYVGTYNGLCTYDCTTGIVSQLDLSGAYRPAHNFFVNAMMRDPQRGCIWLGTEGALLAYRPRSGEISAVPELNGSSVKSLAYTSGGKVVAGTDDGLFIYDDVSGVEIMQCRHDSRDAGSIADNTVWSLFVDSTGNILAGTDMGLSVGDVDAPVRTVALSDITGEGEGQQIYHFLRDREGSLWIGGSNGIIHCDTSGGSMWFRPGDRQHRLSHNRVRHLVQGSDGTVYAATDGGVNVYNPLTSAFENRRITDRAGRRNSNWAYSVEEDPHDRRLWVGAYLGGVFVADRDSLLKAGAGNHLKVGQVFNSGNGMANDLVNDLEIDDYGNKWLLLFRDSAITRISPAGEISRVDILGNTGTYPAMVIKAPGGGVWCASGSVLTRVKGDGSIGLSTEFDTDYSDETVQAMALVGRELWVATLGGDIRVADTLSGKIRLLPLPACGYTAIYNDTLTGRVLLGSADRIVSIDPLRFASRVASDRLHLVEVRSAGVPQDPDTGEIELEASENSLSVDLSTYNFTPGISRRFAYRVAGLDREWNMLPDGVNRIELSNLPEGRHRLEMMLEDNPDSIRSLYLKVNPPWYRTHTAIGVYLLLLLSGAGCAFVALRRRQTRRIEAVERQAALEKVSERIEFLSNISHDLKTPLSMIIGPLSNLRQQSDCDTPAVRRAVDVAYANALKLNELIHRTIELNHVEAMTDAMMVYSRLDVVEFCRTIFSSYCEAYPARRFEFIAPESEVMVNTDAVKLESVLNNLLSNAVKYSDEDSPIVCRIEARRDGGDVLVSVADHGIGIPEEERGLIFQRMFRSARSSSRSEGTGLGLYLVKRYVELLGGSVEVESHTGRGSVFTVCLPFDASEETGADAPSAVMSGIYPEDSDDDRQRVLIVDDNSAIASFVSELLGDEFLTATAPDGNTALGMMARFRPDLVIADEMMPGMSGLEMVRALKATDTPQASVPVILLTARTGTDLESESVRSGVDMFMTKPFEAPLLKARVEQMLRSRARVRQAARIESITEAKPIEAESGHERMLARVTEEVENHIADTALGVAMLCELTGLQSKQLYRLLKRYVGVSPVDFIRQTRLRKAAMLLEQGRFTVSEVMYMVGFSSPSYFSKCFAALYGCTPSQYKSR